ncbi:MULTISPECIES: SDR family NAD(P)-dependent oxidoreductase [unclassified Microcoleus]|uniref:SDR family NAD(P)-dependent oxidoreductase n=1 Tax=unclassified Microcoleus TaxID=2642155 RepID=UPI002FD3C2BB
MTKDIAVIGLACRFPDASSAEVFWSNLVSGLNSIVEIPLDRWDREAYADQTASKWGGFINGIAEFDAGFFAISPREARNMDPQQRLLLEVAWHCIEDSGVAPALLQRNRTGVYMGAMTLDYLQTATATGVEVDGFSCLGGYSCILSNRISHAFGLSGPSVTIDTACSSSLVAIHLARQALLAGDCDMAFVGGVCLNHRPWKHLSFSRARMLSPTGQCRTFDASADGYVPGEGCGVVLLQPLEKAIAENNRILGVIKGSAVNHSAVAESITAPSADRQTALLVSAYTNAAVDPATVTYIEAHGTGTSLGDPIEMEALTRAFSPHSERKGYCKVGSVKTNIGHLEAAAGIAGVVKVLLMMRAKAIAPSLNLATPNPLIDFASSPFVPALELAPWTPAAENLPLRAGVSSFGFGGSNAHLILEAPTESGISPAFSSPGKPSAQMPFLLSAKSASSLEQLVALWRASAERFSHELELWDVCANLALSRESFPWRFGFTASSWDEIRLALERFKPPRANGSVNHQPDSQTLTIDPKSVKPLVEGIALTDADLETVLQHARLLWSRQITFTRLVEAWRAVLREAGLELEDIFGGIHPNEVNRIPVFIAIRSSLRRLCQKWNLTDRYPCGSPQLSELVQLFAEGVFEPADVLGLLSGGTFTGDRTRVKSTEDKTLVGTASSLNDTLSLWLAGSDVDWRECFPGRYQKLSLPLYPFDRQAYWLYPAGDRAASEPPFVSRTFRADDPIVEAHFLNGRLILPAASMACFALDSAQQATGISVQTLSDFELHHAVQIPVGESAEDAGKVELSASVNISDSTLKLSLKGRIVGSAKISAIGDADCDRPLAPQNWLREFGAPRIYAALRARGYQYGTVLQVIRSMSVNDEIAEFLIETDNRTALLDGILQAAVYLRNIWEPTRTPIFEVPAKISTILARDDVAGPFKVRIERQRCKFSASGSDVSAEAMDKSGSLAAAVYGLELSAAPLLSPDISYFEPHWIATPLVSGNSDAGQGLSIIFAGSAPLGLSLFQALRSSSAECRLIVAGGSFEPLGGGMYQMDFTEARNYDRLLEAIAPALAAYAPETPVTVYWVTRPAEQKQPLVSSVADRVAHGVRGVFLLTHTWTRLLPSTPLRLAAITVDAQAVTEHDRALGFASAGIEALGRTASIEVPQIRFKSVDLESAMSIGERSLVILAEVATRFDHDAVAYRGGLRYTRNISELAGRAGEETIIPEGACILVTGGNGALAAEVARAIASQTQVRLILVGRSPANKDTDRLIAEISNLGSIAEYHQSDVADAGALDVLFSHWRETGIKLHGVIHTAGQIEDSLLHNQSAAAFDRAVAPKLVAAVLIGERLCDHPVEFFVAFSSVTPLTGNAGQANYAAANALLDSFCAYRSRNSPGRSIAINWGLWKSRGMGAAANLSDRFRSLGIEPLTAASGRFALMEILTGEFPLQVAVTGKGTAKEVFAASVAGSHPSLPQPTAAIATTTATSSGTAIESIEQELVGLIARTLNTAQENISRQEGFFSLGVESLTIEEIMAELGKRYPGLRPTLLFDYPNIAVLAAYLGSRAPSVAESGLVARQAEEAEVKPLKLPAPAVPPTPNVASVGLAARPTEDAEVKPLKLPAPAVRRAPGYEIAIVGIDGRYPKSPDLDTYWNNLLSGRSCVEEIPSSRWDHAPYFSETRQPNRTQGKWGGFVEGVDLFDPLFFNISPKEAEQIDPQQRLFLESVWHTMEQAGYGSRKSRQGQRVGLFAGVMWHDYSHVARDLSVNDDQSSGAGALFWAIANRVSHFLDFTGPSLAIDTACSSSLTAIHLACQSILMGDCDMAVAGGVNLSLHPFRYLYLSQAGFLSKDGLCRSFGEGGEGYVPGEGVGALLLKPLARAIADGDTIQGVIRGSSINHGGRANGFTVPNAVSQSDLIEQSLRTAGVRFGDLQYIECHGTGTALGDPIEIGALWELAKRESYSGQRIPIGSVKSNIGHLEAAAGIAGVTKVLLAMRHGVIPATLHCQPPNPNIQFSETPFEVTDRNLAWVPGEQQRIACVSSFGAGGSNAHIVLEDWRNPPTVAPETGTWTIVLSARTKDRLVEMASNLRGFLESQHPSLDDLAWTLQAGREPMPERLAIVSHSFEELTDQLDAFASGSLRRNCFSARASNSPGSYSPSNPSDGKLSDDEIASLWTKGADIDWAASRASGSRRIPLPVYPFARERYWLTPSNDLNTREPARQEVKAVANSRLFAKVWIQEEGEEETHGRERLRIGVLSSGGFGNELYRQLCNFPEIECVRFQETDFPIQTARIGDLDAFLDAIDFERERNLRVHPQASRLAVYQSLLDSVAQRSLRLLHITCGHSQSNDETPNLGGSWIASLFPVLCCEHRSVRARTIEVESLMTAQEVAEALRRELRLDGARAEVRYRDGIRTVADWEALPVPRSQWQLDAAKVYVVTGGTSGLGAQVAAWLAARGARKLLLLGVTALPPREKWSTSQIDSYSEAVQERIRHVQELEKSGVQVRLFSGKLTESSRLQSFFESSSRELGQISGVVHCAGVTPEGVGSFIRKNVDEILQTLEPKVDGLIALAELVPPVSVDFFHLFSSVSGSVPALGAGISDYACANGFLNAFAEVYRSAGANITAINWPNWSGAGSARGESARYRQLGFKTLTVGEALALYESIASSPVPPVVLPCTVDEQLFRVGQLGMALPSDTLPVTRASSPSVPSTPPGAAQGAWSWLADWFSKELKIPRERLDGTTNFAEYGVDSILLADLAQAIEKRAGSPMDPSQLLELSNLDSLSDYLATRWATEFGEASAPQPMEFGEASVAQPTEFGEASVAQPSAEQRPAATHVGQPNSAREVAVIGIGCHFPGSGNASDFWANLIAGVNSIREVPASRWDHRLLYGNGEAGKLTSKWGGFLEGIEMFDADYFGIRDVEAAQVDPSIRQILEVFAETVRHAGYEEAELRGKQVGVFVGARAGSYPQRYGNWSKNSIVGAGQNFIASLSSHVFDWKGPSLAIDSACSSSLVAVHLACRSLMDGECSMAVAGGVDLLLDEQPYRILSAAKALSPDGRCYTFDLRANGFVPGEGCGAVLLKRLDRALADGDRIYAVIEGSAINNDGRTMGTTTPSLEGQQRVIEAALASAGVDGASVSYVEAHGTGTMIGDPIELKALSRAIGKHTEDKGFCAVGSVKTNIGHLLSAAGVAGFIKTALAAWHGRIPPTLHCDRPNPRFDFENSPLFPCVRDQLWNPRREVRRAGISSFGFGGTNCHVVLRSHRDLDSKTPRRTPLAPPEYQRKYAWIEKKPSQAVARASVESRAALLGFEEILTR